MDGCVGRTRPRASRSPPRRDAAVPGTVRIAIVGAGLGGLACACTLKKDGVDAIILEADASIDAGRGGEIQLRSTVIVSNELSDCSQSVAHIRASSSLPFSRSQILTVRTWMRLRAASQSLRSSSIPIRALRKELAQQLRSDAIRFGKKVIDLVPDETARVRCVFADGDESEPFDVIVDAGGLNPAFVQGPGIDPGKERCSCIASQPVFDAHATIGDARLARQHGPGGLLCSWWRLRNGGDDALADGVGLGKLLGEQAKLGGGWHKWPISYHLNRIHIEGYAAHSVKVAPVPTDPRGVLSF